jgi:hypothetical protein
LTAKKPKKPKPEEIETEPDAWERFEKTIGKIVPPKRPKPKDRGVKRRNSKEEKNK